MTPFAFRDWLALPAATRRPLIMGICNVTPDSFSDGGKFSSAESAVAHAIRMVDQGADIIDIGGESTRPGALPVSPQEQFERVTPVIRGLIAKRPEQLISIDTTSAVVAESAVKSGAFIINDVSAGLDDNDMLGMAGRLKCPIVLMHRPGPSQTMQDDPRYSDVVADVATYLGLRIAVGKLSGIPPEHILIDPGIGFGKTTEHDLALLRAIPHFKQFGHPVLIGVSRKKFIGQLTGQTVAAERVFGTAAAVTYSVANGADIVRVHDVEAMRQVVAVADRFRAKN